MNRSTIYAIVCNLLLIPIVTDTRAGISGDTELRLQVDNTHFGETETSLEQWSAIYYKDLSTGLDIGVQFAVEAREANTSGQLYQCYIRSDGKGERPDLTLGRFEIIENGGFNTLDGISISQQLSAIDWRVYGGKPRRIEAYWEEDADLLIGLSSNYDLLSLVQTKQFKQLNFNFGLERRWAHSQQMDLHLSLTGVRPELDEDLQLNDFHLAADMNLDDQSLQRVVVDSHYDLKTQGYLRLGYRYYRPNEEPETFRDRYHGFFSMERQSILKGVWHLPKRAGLETNFELNGSRQEQGNGGFGLATELIYFTRFGPVIDGRVDYMESDDDYATSIYLRYRQPITSMSTVELESVYQKKQTRLSGDNNLKGFSFSLAHKVLSQLRLDLSGEWLDHSTRDDEYRLGLSLRYDFYQTNVGELP